MGAPFQEGRHAEMVDRSGKAAETGPRARVVFVVSCFISRRFRNARCNAHTLVRVAELR